MTEELLQDWIEKRLEQLADKLDEKYYYAPLEEKAAVADCTKQIRDLGIEILNSARFETTTDAA